MVALILLQGRCPTPKDHFPRMVSDLSIFARCHQYLLCRHQGNVVHTCSVGCVYGLCDIAKINFPVAVQEKSFVTASLKDLLQRAIESAPLQLLLVDGKLNCV